MRAELRDRRNPDIAVHSARFFKSGSGQYGDGDRYLGIRVPALRSIAKKYRGAPLAAILSVLRSSWHEERLFAVLLLAQEYKFGSARHKQAIYKAYLANRAFVNNWDIVDSSAHLIVGPELETGSRDILLELAASDRIWDRRIAMLATFHFIRKNEFADALHIAHLLKDDEHDLIHKAVGWMLREIGNRDIAAEERFLKIHYRTLPRTMLRYAIEKFPEARRKAYLYGKV